MSDEQSLLIRFLEYMSEQEGHGPSIPSVCVMHHQGRRKLFVEVNHVDDPLIGTIPIEFDGMPTKIVPYIDTNPYFEKAKKIVWNRLDPSGNKPTGHVPVELARELLGDYAWKIERLGPECFTETGEIFRGRVTNMLVSKLMREADAWKSWELDPVTT